MVKFFKELWEIIKFAFFNMDDSKEEVKEPVDLDVPHETPPTYVPPALLWDTKEHVRKSIRVIGDEYNLTWHQKDLLCDISQCESGFVLKARLENSPKSIDRGLFQINSYWNSTVTDEQAYDPEWSTRWAIKNGILPKKCMIFWSASAKCWNKGGKYDDII